MKLCGIVLACMAILLFQISAYAMIPDRTSHRYESIAIRNVFHLETTPIRMEAKSAPPPAINLQGFTCRSGRKQALFKVGPTAFLLNQGDRHGEIEVLEINEHAGTVTFRNHGQEQTLCLSGQNCRE